MSRKEYYELIKKDKLFWIYIVIIVLITIWHINDKQNFDIKTFLGLLVGILIAMIQRLVSLDEAHKIKLYKELGLNRILLHRDSEDEYRERIKKVQDKLYIMGHTAKRLIEHFADVQGRADKKVLLEALSRGVDVRILISNKQYLNESKKIEFETTKSKMLHIKELHSNFIVKYYNHIPTHSLFLCDKECLIGPIFTNLESRDTPTLDMSYDGEYASKYIKYFDNEWNNAEELQAE